MRAAIHKPILLVLVGGVILALALAAFSTGPRPVSEGGTFAGASMGVAAVDTSRGLSSAAAVTVKGKITCLAWFEPVGVWVDAATSKDGWAKIATAINTPGGLSIVDYSFKLNKGGKFRVHVGCGGTPENWGLTLKSPLVSGTKVNFKCNDINPVLSTLGKRFLGLWFDQGIAYGTCKKV